MMHSKVKKQVDLNKHLLCQELDKVKKSEKIELKMIETSRRRFRLKYKKDKLTHFGVKATEEHTKEEPSNSSEDLDIEEKMRIREEKVMNRISEMIFTKGEVDIEKLLCLHLLTAHEISTDNNPTDAVSPVSKKVSEVSTPLDAESKYNLNNPWNETLPCYIVQIKADESIIRKKLEQEYVAQLDQEGKAIYDLEVQCRKYAENNEEFNRALKSRLHAPISFGMIPTISEQLYKSLQGSPCERSELFTDRPSSAKSEKKQTSLTKLTARKPFMINAFQPSEACLAKRKPKHYLYFDASFNFNKMKKAKIKLTSLSVNNELKILVQLVLEVLQTVHIEKVNQFLEIIRDPKKINTTLIKPKVKLFLRSFKDSNIVSSPENYVLISGLAKEENNASVKNKFQNKLIAETLETQAIVELDDLLTKIRKELKIKVENECNSNILLKNENVQTSESNLKDTNKKKHLRQSSAEVNINETVKKLHNYQEPKQHKQVDSSRSINKDEIKVTNNIKTLPESDSSRNSITKQSSSVQSSSTSNQILSSSQSNYKKILEETQLNVNQDVGYFDPDKIILRRMTNEQRILVGQMCASLKTKKINSQGVLREKVPLAALITPVLSHESIKRLTKGTIYAKEEEEVKKPEEVKIESEVISEKLTDSLISKLRHKIAESETQRKLEKFMKKGI